MASSDSPRTPTPRGGERKACSTGCPSPSKYGRGGTEKMILQTQERRITPVTHPRIPKTGLVAG